MEKFDDRVDLYISKAAPFAQPILEYLREVIHEASPELKETIKWSSPFFDHKGPVCHIVAFKQHCAFGFWKAKLIPELQAYDGDEARGSFGRITSVEELPSKETLIALVQKAVALNEDEVKVEKKKVDKGTLIIPGYLIGALETDPDAKLHFEKFSTSQKREYVDWLADAKTEATRQKRLDTALEWISEGKQRNWKYQKQ